MKMYLHFSEYNQEVAYAKVLDHEQSWNVFLWKN